MKATRLGHKTAPLWGALVVQVCGWRSPCAFFAWWCCVVVLRDGFVWWCCVLVVRAGGACWCCVLVFGCRCRVLRGCPRALLRLCGTASSLHMALPTPIAVQPKHVPFHRRHRPASSWPLPPTPPPSLRMAPPAAIAVQPQHAPCHRFHRPASSLSPPPPPFHSLLMTPATTAIVQPPHPPCHIHRPASM